MTDSVSKEQEAPDVEIRRFIDGKGRALLAHVPLDNRPPQFFAVVFVSASPDPNVEPIQFTEHLVVKMEYPEWTGGATDRALTVCTLAQQALRKYDEVLEANKAMIDHKCKVLFARREHERQGHIPPGIVDATGTPIVKRR